MLSDLVKGYAAATLESAHAAGSDATVAGDLEAFARAIILNDNLRAALLDPALATSARLGIAADLVAGRVASESAAIIRFVLRVTPAAEVASTFNDLVLFAAAPHLAVASRRVHDRMRGYAERVFEELTDPADLDAVEDDLFSLARAIEASTDLRDAFGDDSAERRVGLARDLLTSKIRSATLRIVAELLSSGRIRNLAGVLGWLASLVAEERGRRIAEVRSAVPLDDDERARLANALGRLTGREVEVRVIEDPAVIGGVLISVGDFMIDATVRLRLERLRDALAVTA
jgi:F-type H+-transporting ATPase subunit delta